jgi:predicted DNA-binding protein YlxM (UPF0122 family)
MADKAISTTNHKQAAKTQNQVKRGRGKPPKVINYDKLTEYASQDIPNYEIAKALNISVRVFYDRLKNDTEFQLAYEQGIENRKYELEKALYRRAEGYSVEEKRVVVNKDPIRGESIQTTITEKNYVPDTTALIFALSNRYSEKYKQRAEPTQIDINVNIKQIDRLSDTELFKIASGEFLEGIDYQVE